VEISVDKNDLVLVPLGIQDIDEGHQRIYDALVDAYDCCLSLNRDSLFDNFLADVVYQMTLHFAYEEKMMQGHDYEGLQEHHQEHALILSNALELCSVIDGKGVLDAELVRFLLNSFLHHIQFIHGQMYRHISRVNS